MNQYLYSVCIPLQHHLITQGDIQCEISYSDQYRIDISSSLGVLGFSGKTTQDLQNDLLNGLAYFSKDLVKFKHAVLVIAELLTNFNKALEDLKAEIEKQTANINGTTDLEKQLSEIFGQPVKIMYFN